MDVRIIANTVAYCFSIFGQSKENRNVSHVVEIITYSCCNTVTYFKGFIPSGGWNIKQR